MRDSYGLVGRTIDRRYEVRRVVAEGGFGVVYEAEAIALGVRTAIKVLRSEIVSSSPEARRRFEQEARVLAKLRHPGIVSIIDASHLDDGTPYLALEWIDGETLDEYVQRVGPLPLDDTLRLLGPVASAIAYAHDEGVVHRDLKPGNLMIARGTFAAKVLDFGLARWTSPHGVKTSTLAGTGLSIGFAAPEQYGKEFGPVDGRADQFGLAAVAHAALTATPPFAGETLTAVMYATCMSSKRPSVLEARDDLPRAVDAVLQRALSIRPDDRYESIRDFWLALEEAARHGDSSDAVATLRDAPPRTNVARTLPQAATLPSPVLDVAPKTVVAESAAVAPTQRAPMTGPAGTEPTGAPPSSRSMPESVAPSTRASPASRWILFVSIGAAIGAGVFAIWPLVAPARPKPPPPAISVPTATASPTKSAVVGPCGTIADTELCIVGGRFRRGPSDCAIDDPPHRAACPTSTHEIASFVIDRFEVSNARYGECVKKGKCAAADVTGDDALPVRGVSADDAAKFCAFDHGKRLPSDEEWELAASGHEHRLFPWGNTMATPKLAVFAENAPGAPMPVDAPLGTTPEGMHHVAGNVAEWTATTAPANAPWPEGLAETPGPRVWVRGGAFDRGWDALRTWAREAYPRSTRSPAIGFRCAKNASK